MRFLYLQQKDMPEFITRLKKNHRVVAPVKKENQFVFSDIDGASSVCLDYIPTILPPKKYFLGQHQELGRFSIDKAAMRQTKVDADPTIIFGVHTCDISGIECLDVVFNESPPDPYFIKRKESITIIGYECITPCDKYATCITMGTYNPKTGYDVMISDVGDRYIIHINSEKGRKAIGTNPLLVKPENAAKVKSRLLKMREGKKKHFDVLLDAQYKELSEIFNKCYDSKVWKDVGKRCVSCGNCTAVCPTCYCFDIYDEVRLDMSGGGRKRVWDSCQLEEFSAVAGGGNFRKERSSRQRHRYYRKFDYPVRKFNKYFCTGCGRCARTCMARISLIETVNDLTKECKLAK